MSDIQKLTNAIITFNQERDWIKFLTPKDLLLGILIEAGELGEHLIWDRSNPDYLQSNKKIIEDEFADTFHYMLLLADILDIDIPHACKQKLKKTAIKYPIEKSKGHTTKYSQLT